MLNWQSIRNYNTKYIPFGLLWCYSSYRKEKTPTTMYTFTDVGKILDLPPIECLKIFRNIQSDFAIGYGLESVAINIDSKLSASDIELLTIAVLGKSPIDLLITR